MTNFPNVSGHRRRRTALALLAAALLGLSVAGCASSPLGGAAGAAGGAGGAGTPTPAAPELPTTAQAGNSTIVAISPPGQQCCKKQTLPEFLGLDGLVKGVGSLAHCLITRIATALDLEGRFPGLQAKPPLLPITDPANMNADAPPVLKAAADAKTEEDTAPQKIMAIRYLAGLGCGGCYPNIEDALLASLDDCTEAVRYEAVSALRSASRPPCHYCNSKRCCSAKVQKKLRAIAFDTDKSEGCFLEPSDRVRRGARLALDRCGGLSPESPTPSGDVPLEGPVEPAPGEGGSVARQPRSDSSTVRLKSRAADDNVPTVRSALLQGVRLASLVATPKAADGGDLEVARVNGEPIFESQVAPQLEGLMKGWQDQGVHPGPDALQAAWQVEVQRAVDVKLLTQRARQDLISQRKLAPNERLTPDRFLDWYEQSLPVKEEISMLELTEYYQEHQPELRTPARVRWEGITLFVGGFSSRDEAFAVMQSFRARAQGFPVAEVPFSRQVVQIDTHGWTSGADVKSKIVRQTLFSLPVGKLSPILDEGDTLHLVRVLERQSAGVKPFDEVAEDLRRDLLQQRFVQAERQYVARVRQASQVVTIFDNGQPSRTARLPRKGGEAPATGTPMPAVTRPPAPAATGNGGMSAPNQPAAQPIGGATSAAAPASGNARGPMPAAGQVIPAAAGMNQSRAIETGGVRPANMLEVGEQVRQGVYLESNQAPQSLRLSAGPSNIPTRRPSAAVTGPGSPQWQSPGNSAMMGTNTTAVR